MQNNFFRRLNQVFNRIHLQDTEIKTKGESIYINPTVKLIIGWSIFLVAFLLFIIIGKPCAHTGNGTAGGQKEQTSNEDYVPFQRNEYPEINSFVENYLNAITSEDVTVLSTMVKDPTPYTPERLSQRKQYVLSYSNVDCYTKPGLTDGSYVVYAIVNTQIPGVEVQPLSMHLLYLVPNEYGGFILDNTTVSEPDIDAYLNQIERDPDVVELYDRVTQNNDESAARDEELQNFRNSIQDTN